MVADGLAPDLNTYGAFMDRFARVGDVHGAGALYDAMTIDHRALDGRRHRPFGGSSGGFSMAGEEWGEDAAGRACGWRWSPRAPARASPKPTRWRC